MALLCAATVAVGSLCGLAAPVNGTMNQVQAAEKNTAAVKTPKYIFMFIGDGMSYPQIQITNSYLSALSDQNNDGILQAQEYLSYSHFPVNGSAQTYDSTSFCPDSASTATSLSTGHKTYSGTINMDESKTVAYETIAEKLKKQKGYKVGVISTVNLNHATPAAYYAHQASRNNYYEIGLEMINSNFDYFAGGGLKKTTGNNKDQANLYDIAAASGYKVIKTQAQAAALTAKDGKAIVIDEHLADSDAMSYQLDVKPGEWALKDYVKKGIDVLNNEKGFFMMVEGGKIDWACHANDAASTIYDTVALSESVSAAVDFYNQHPSETLIIVTGDHETGGLTIGYAGTNYDTFLTNLSTQKISYAKYDSDYVEKYKENKTGFNDVLNDVHNLFGLTTEKNAATAASNKLVMTDYELSQLKAAYNRTMKVGVGKQKEMSQEEYVLYGEYEPLTVTITHILNNKSGVNFASYSHTGLPTAVFAQGVNAGAFEGNYDNTAIYTKLAQMTGVK